MSGRHTPPHLEPAPAPAPHPDETADATRRWRQLAVAFDSAPVGMAVTSDTGRLLQANTALGQLLGRPEQALPGRRLEDLAPPQAARAITAGRKQMLTSGVSRHVVDSTLRHADSRDIPVTLTCARVPGSAEDDACLIVHVQDRTDRVATEAELTRRSLHDPLTGLPNRALLLDRLSQAIAGLGRTPSSVAVLFVDLDGFKTINDTFGHSCGDQVLVAVAHRLQSLQRSVDTVCRYGGDEFVVLCTDSGPAEVGKVARRIEQAFTAPFTCTPPQPHTGPAGSAPGRIAVSASLGIAVTDDPASTARALLHQADTDMYRDKYHR